jgi:hypothetical protein
MNKYSLSKNLGFFTGPVLIIMGAFALKNPEMPPFLAYSFIGFGIIRLLLTLYVHFKSNKNESNS